MSSYKELVNKIDDPIIEDALKKWFAGDDDAARFAVYVDKFLRVKFMDMESKIVSIDRRLRRIGANTKQRFDQADDRMDEIEEKLDGLLEEIRKLNSK